MTKFQVRMLLLLTMFRDSSATLCKNNGLDKITKCADVFGGDAFGVAVVTFALSGRMIGSLLSTLTSLVGSFAPALTFLSTISTSVSETRFFDKLLVYRWALTVHPYCLICSSTLSNTISCSQQ